MDNKMIRKVDKQEVMHGSINMWHLQLNGYSHVPMAHNML